MINRAFNHERVKKMKLFTKPSVEYNLFKCHWRLFLLDPAKFDNEHPRYRRQLKRSMTDAQIVSEALELSEELLLSHNVIQRLSGLRNTGALTLKTLRISTIIT